MPKTKETSIKIGTGCSIFQLRQNWYIRFYDPRSKPSRKKQALKTTDRSEALRLGTVFYKKWMDHEDPFDPWAGHTSRARHDATLEEALEAYQTDRGYSLSKKWLRHVAWVVGKFGRSQRIEYLSDATPEAVRRFVYRAELSQATRGNYWRTVSAFFNWCMKHLYVDENPCAKIDRPKDYKAHPAAMTEQDLERLLTAVEVHFETCPRIPGRRDKSKRVPNQYWMSDAFDLMAATGLRPSELRRLRWGDIEWPVTEASGEMVLPGALHVRAHDGELTKTAEDRRVTMLPRAHRRLEYLQKETRLSNDSKEHVLKGPDGCGPINQRSLTYRFAYFRDKAGLSRDFNLYSLRHFFATELARRGLSATLLQKEMGHKKYETTAKYLHVADTERRRATFALFVETAK